MTTPSRVQERREGDGARPSVQTVQVSHENRQRKTEQLGLKINPPEVDLARPR